MISNPAGIELDSLDEFLCDLASNHKGDRVAIVAPDYSRIASQSGAIANLLLKHFGKRIVAVIPALGTHLPMSSDEKSEMFSSFSPNLFIDHKYRSDVEHIGTITKGEVEETSQIEGLYDLPFYVNSSLVDGSFDLIISVGQLLPHEVIGISGGSKNILIGLGGRPTIEVSHYISAMWGIERTLGNPDTPLRRLLNRGLELLLHSSPPVLFINTVLNPTNAEERRLIHIGADLVTREKPQDRSFAGSAEVAVATNIFNLNRSYNEVIAYLEPKVYRSTWIGNKAIYRSRLLIPDNANLRIIAPGVDRFGEDPQIDSILRHYGYHGYESIEQMRRDDALDENLAAAAHILHGSTFDRFKVSYAAPELGREAIEAVGYSYDYELDEEASRQNNVHAEGTDTTKADILFSTDESGRLHIYHPGVALWKRDAQ